MKDRGIIRVRKAVQRLFSFSCLLMLFFVPNCLGQVKYNSLKVGDDISNTPAFKNVVNYSGNHLSLKDLKGKIIILDFWSTGCSSCIASIPHLEQLQRDFEGKIQIIMVNPWEPKNKISERVSKMKILRAGIGLTTLPNVYGDTVWRTIFPHTALPHHVWIDKDGKVMATTSSINATKEHIQEILDGKKVHLSIKKDLKASGYDERKEGLMRLGDTSIRVRFYSAFSKSNTGFGGGTKIKVDSVLDVYKRSIFNESILQLFQTAYKNHPLILEVKDSTKYFRPHDPNKFDKWFRDNCYCYEIVLPLSESENIFTYMENDFTRFFLLERKIKGGLEKRQFPTITLKLRKKYFLKKSHDGNNAIDDIKYYKFNDESFGNIKEYLKNSIELKSYAFSDETGLDNANKVSLYIPKNLRDLKALREEFWRQGFDFNITKKVQEVLVIKDQF